MHSFAETPNSCTRAPLEVRPLTVHEVPQVIDYFLQADTDLLRLMGVDPNKLPDRETWLQRLTADYQKTDPERSFFYLGWVNQGSLIGHSNINNIQYGQQACIHLHLWHPQSRKNGYGPVFFQKSIAYFANRFRLQKIICEPHADNSGPNTVLEKSGFTFIKQYQTIPGWINSEQMVNRWELYLNQA